MLLMVGDRVCPLFWRRARPPGFRLLNSGDCNSYKIIYSESSLQPKNASKLLIPLVGAVGFEPTTPCAQGRCATRLRYAPTCEGLFILKHFLTRRTPRRGQKLPKTGPTVAKP
jgi:hypothetical protein